MLAAGTQLGPYQVLAPLGAGGMGEVYRAHDSRLGRDVALKVLPPQFAPDADRARPLRARGQGRRRLAHPNILVLYDVGTDEGAQLRRHGAARRRDAARSAWPTGRLPWRKAVEIGLAIAEGLAAAHAKGIIHRDLKPENLFLTADGRVKILDFGLAQRRSPASTDAGTTGAYAPAATEPGTVMGTVGYMSPEQVRGAGGRRPQRPLLARLRAPRDGDRAAAVRRRDGGGDA